MNEFQIGAQPIAGGYLAWIRKVHRADNEVIKGKGGKPVIYPTREAAKAAAGDAMVAYINGSLVRDGEVIKARSEGDAHFPTLKPIRRNGRVIPVERARA